MLGFLFIGGLLVVLVACCKPSRRLVHPSLNRKPVIYPVKVIGYTVQTTGSDKVYRATCK